jgi:hypothetical protein
VPLGVLVWKGFHNDLTANPVEAAAKPATGSSPADRSGHAVSK